MLSPKQSNIKAVRILPLSHVINIEYARARVCWDRRRDDDAAQTQRDISQQYQWNFGDCLSFVIVVRANKYVNLETNLDISKT